MVTYASLLSRVCVRASLRAYVRTRACAACMRGFILYLSFVTITVGWLCLGQPVKDLNKLKSVITDEVPCR